MPSPPPTDSPMATPRPAATRRFAGVSAVGLALTVAAGTGFALILLLVRAQWPPLEGLDHGVADGLNAVVSGSPGLQAVLRAITAAGSTLVLTCVVAVVAVGLLVRGRGRLAIYLVITGLGALIMGPALKVAVGRLRPVVEHTVALAPGNSFPSGHSLGSFTCYGALLLVFLPALTPRGRRIAFAVTAAVILLIGFSRVALGVHFVTDVLGGWLLAATWLAVTATAFESWRRQVGRPPSAPTSEGLEPEAARDVHPAPEDEHAGTGAGWRTGAGLGIAWVLVFGALMSVGELLVRDPDAGLLGDQSVPRWLAGHRTPVQDGLSEFASRIGSTPIIIAVSAAAVAWILAVTRHWRPALFVVVVMTGEITLFLAVVSLTDRPRPDVPRLDGHLPTSSYPSGHLAATICLYGALALLVLAGTRRWWRWVPVALAVLLPGIVAWGRLYRGMHHPTDIAASVLLAVAWLTAAYLFIRPAVVLAKVPEAPLRKAAREIAHEIR
ncbi:MAG: phosphatase PAP2 family protein [Hamadaea sp.]|nr:phosphatase PAP2 family protein [Hamadaea sp.]